MRKIQDFISREDGAVTVDWVVLTSLVIGFGIIVMLNFADPIQHVDSETGNALSGVNIADLNLGITP